MLYFRYSYFLLYLDMTVENTWNLYCHRSNNINKIFKPFINIFKLISRTKGINKDTKIKKFYLKYIIKFKSSD